MTWNECLSKLTTLIAERLGGGRMLPRETLRVMEKRRAARARREWPVEIESQTERVWRGRTIDISVSGMRVRFDDPLDLRWRNFISLDPGNSLGPIAVRFALVREIVPSREYAVRFLDLQPWYIRRLSPLLAS